MHRHEQRTPRGNWLGRMGSGINPLYLPAIFVALVMTTLQVGGLFDSWYTVAGLLLLNLFCIRIMTWLVGEVAIAVLVTAEEWVAVLLTYRRVHTNRGNARGARPFQSNPVVFSRTKSVRGPVDHRKKACNARVSGRHRVPTG